ncbi:Ger(x)C family spore germination protein [Gracilibacillus lacisalsi]|uniref:Ger(x)C family spore germination protein n=1 Tax=Gracilibacillus lacisalsi TaxID=393087 RepID=UPI0003722419|nr:Ger(x)C family spore germination protein [Gracilibacillus lacisalsi]
MNYLTKMSSISILLLLLTGCWSARELTDITIATAMAIDKDNDNYKVTIQVLNPSEIAGDTRSDRATISTYSATGTSIFEALRRITKTSPRKIHLSHLQLIVYGEELAREGVGKTLDFLVRDHELRTDFDIAVAQGTSAKTLVSILTPLEQIPATKIESSIQSSEDFWAPTKEVQLNEFVDMISSKGMEAVLTGIYMEGDPETGMKMKNTEYSNAPVKVHLNSMGVFRGDKLIGWLNEDESKGFNYITDNVTNTVGWVNCEDGGTLSAETIQSITDLQGLWKNGQPSVKIDVQVKANVGDVECKIDLSNPKNIEKIEKKLEQKTKDLIEQSIKKAKDFNSDIFGFGQAIKRSHPHQWRTIEDDWGSLFSNVSTEVNAEIELKRAGMISKPIYDIINRKTENEE